MHHKLLLLAVVLAVIVTLVTPDGSSNEGEEIPRSPPHRVTVSGHRNQSGHWVSKVVLGDIRHRGAKYEEGSSHLDVQFYPVTCKSRTNGVDVVVTISAPTLTESERESKIPSTMARFGPTAEDGSRPGVDYRSKPPVEVDSGPGVEGHPKPPVKGRPKPPVEVTPVPPFKARFGPTAEDGSRPGVDYRSKPPVEVDSGPGVEGHSKPPVKGRPKPPVEVTPVPPFKARFVPPEGYVTLQGVGYYRYHSDKLPWSAARNGCIIDGGDLVQINTVAKFNFIKNLGSVWIWTDLQERGINGFYYTLSDEFWNPPLFVHWHPGHPNMDGGDDCVLMLMSDGTLVDADCETYSGNYLCEIPWQS